MNIRFNKLAAKLNVKEQWHFTATIADEDVSISTFAKARPDWAVGITIKDVEDHEFQAKDADGNPVANADGTPKMITIKRAKFAGWLPGEVLSKPEEMRLQGEIRESTHLKAVELAGKSAYTGNLSF